jgi:hypothetical protein
MIMSRPADHQSKEKSLTGMRVFFALVLTLGLVFIFGADSEGFKSFGHALLIAGFLALTVDYYAKIHLVKEATNNIDLYLLGYALPREIQYKIKEVRETRIIRKKWKCTYTIQPHPDGEPNQIKLITDLYFEAENITNQDQWYRHRLDLERLALPDIECLSCHSNDVDARYNLYGEALRARINEFNEKNPGSVSIEIAADRIKLLPESYLWYEFRARYSQIYPAIGTDHFQFLEPNIPTIGVTITVEDSENFKVDFPSKPLESGTEWTDPRIFLPGEIITIWWRPKTPADAA